MKKIFARTENVNSLVASLTRLMNRPSELPGMMLVHSRPGLGKTRTCLWWAAQNNGEYIRTLKLMNGRWLLESIVAQLGHEPRNRKSDLFRQVCDLLIGHPRPLFFDEIDRLSLSADIVETLRDIHDVTENPIIFIGMEGSEGKFARYRALDSRFSERVEFKPLCSADVRSIADQMCDVQIADDAINYIYTALGVREFRKAVVQFYKCESFARANNLKTPVTAAHMAGMKK
jgi:AAA domain